MIHIEKIDGYQIFAHEPCAVDISDTINEILERKKVNIRVKLNHKDQHIMKDTEFEELCTAHFEENFETLAAESPLILPCKEPEILKGVVKVMQEWCRKRNKLSKIKGLILHSFSALRHLEHFGFTREVLKGSFKIEEFSEKSIVVYNPQEYMLLLIRNAESQDLVTDIKLGLDDLKMFILLFSDKLKGSNMKLISLVVTDKEHNLESICPDCINSNVIPLETFKDADTFNNWCEAKASYFEIGTIEKINTNFVKSFSAKITGTMAATFIYGKYVPTMTKNPVKRMISSKVLLTRKQMEIFNSQDKHMIIRGGFGCGKTIIAEAMFRKMSENLKNDEKLYFICYDSRSELLHQMAKDAQENKLINVTLFHNKEKRKLSEIIKGILEENESTRKMNFVVDEFDGEDLDESEAKSLNGIFNESLKESYILLVEQPIKKERVVNNTRQERNMFELLKNMKLYELNRVMRNSVEIHNLVKLTADVLEKQTVFIHQEHNTVESELITHERQGGNYESLKSNVSKNEVVKKLPNPPPDVNAKLPPRQTDPHEYPKIKPSIPALGLDEAQAVSRSATGAGDKGIKTISEFQFAAADKTGHKIRSNKPAFFEVGDKSDFEKVLSLIAIFEHREIYKSEHVVLHFDTITNEIPNIFLFPLTHHFDLKEKLTNEYRALNPTKKSVLVCSYCTFRGLEHPKITIVIDRDIYYIQHYLVEALARCTTDLWVVVLENSPTLTDVTANWKAKQAIKQWEIKILIDASLEENVELESTSNENSDIITTKFKLEYYKKLKEKYVASVNTDKNFESEKELAAKKIILQR